MNDEENISCVNLISTFENNDVYSELDEEVEKLVIIDEKEEVAHNIDSIPVIKKCFNGMHHESVKNNQGKVKRSIKPIPGYDTPFCHFTKEQDKEICVDSKTGDWIKVENVPVEQKNGIQHTEDYTEFFKAN